MCILCGEFFESIHWTEFKDIDKDQIISGEFQRNRQRSRNKRVELGSKVLEFYGLKLSEWNNSRYILMNNKGRMEVLNDLSEVWKHAERLTQKKVDPFDDKLLNYLVAGNSDE